MWPEQLGCISQPLLVFERVLANHPALISAFMDIPSRKSLLAARLSGLPGSYASVPKNLNCPHVQEYIMTGVQIDDRPTTT